MMANSSSSAESLQDDESIQLISQGTDAFMDDDLETALSLFSKAVASNPSSADAFLKRAATYSKLAKHSEALNDASCAHMLALSSSGTTDMAAKALLRKGIALCQLEREAEAITTFEEAKKLGCQERLLETWMEKARKALPEQQQVTVEPMNATSSTFTATTSQPAPTAVHPLAAFLPSSKIRHEWFQSDSFITISIFIKKCTQDAVSIDYHSRSLSVTIRHPSLPSTDYTLDLDPLAHEIIPEESKHAVLGTKVEIKLKKKSVGVKWGTLEGEDNPITQTMVSGADARPAYPSSSKKNVNWDAIEKSVEEEKPEGEQALNALFKQIYRDASEDTRRAMMKSYVESNGTCLSTNWSEVGKGTVATTPPDGMVAKKFESI